MPAVAPSARYSVPRSCISSNALSIPSRLTISSVKRKTPVNAAVPGFTLDDCRRPSISPFIRRPARHMWTIIQVTEAAATMASGPSSSS